MLRALRLMLVAWLATLLGRLLDRRRHPRWPFGLELVVRYLRLDWDETASWDLTRLAADLERRPFPRHFVKKVQREAITIGGVPATRFVPPTSRGAGRLLCLHGGSYIYGSSRSTHAEFFARLAYETGVEAIGLDYRLAPEHPYPAQIEDALSAFDALVADGVPPERIVLVGDSAGGNLALALQIALRNRGGAQAGAAVLSSPWSDLEMPGASFAENEPIDFGTRAVLVTHARTFAGDVPLSDPRISPTHADLKGLAPCLVTVGECELPRDDILTLAQRLRDAGVEVTQHVAPDMPHNAPFLATLHPAAQAAHDTIVSYVCAWLAPVRAVARTEDSGGARSA